MHVNVIADLIFVFAGSVMQSVEIIRIRNLFIEFYAMNEINFETEWKFFVCIYAEMQSIQTYQ